MRFTHLHNHSHYSLLDALSKVDEMVLRCKELEMNAIALTDHGNLSGAVQLWRNCKKQDIKPIVGCELYIATRDMTLRERVKNLRNYHHLVVLAMNSEGYQNLCYLVSKAFIDGFYYKPRVDKALLAKHSRGLFASTACMVGEVAQTLLNTENNDEALREAGKIVRDLHGIFGDNLRIELQDHGFDEQKLINIRAMTLSQDTGVPLVLTNDCHFIHEKDFEPHKALKCINMHQPFTTTDHVYVPEHRLKSPEEMLQILNSYDESYHETLRNAIEETSRVAERCDFEFTKGVYHFPDVELKEDETVRSKFRTEVLDGFADRSPGFDRNRLHEYIQRLYYELSLIERMGFPGYFLVVADFVRYARENDIPVGPGRGSAAGSLVSYSLGITDLDPIYHGLLFERFLNPARISMPDIDIDFSKRHRYEVIDYIVQKYGRDNVAQIATFGGFKPRAAINDLGRVHEMQGAEIRSFSHLVPETPGKPFTLALALKEIPDIKNRLRGSTKLRQVWAQAERIEGCNRHISRHAAGVVITPKPIHSYAPLYQERKTGEISAGYEMGDLEDLGLIKMDILGLKTLDLIQDCAELVEKNHGIDVDLDEISRKLDDEYVISLFARGNTKGVFQFESQGMRDHLRLLKPERFDDLVAMNALYRPGPMDAKDEHGHSMLDNYILRKNGEKEAVAMHPKLKGILKPTYGVLVFQEQVMELVQILANYSLGEADVVRKAMGKKDAKLMAEQTKKFVEAAGAQGNDKTEMAAVAAQIKKFGRYGFNRAHAAAYTLLGWQTAWLKAYYPIEFMAALLTNETEDNKPEKIQEYVGDTRLMRIDILPPDVNYSGVYFLVEKVEEKDSIRYGLAAIKDVGISVCEEIVQEREARGLYKSLPDLLNRCNLRSTAVTALICAGATDSLGGNRATHFENFEVLLKRKRKDKTVPGQVNLFAEIGEMDRMLELLMEPATEWDRQEKNIREKEYLGLWLTDHPLNSFTDRIETDIASIRGIKKKGVPVEVVCVVTNFIQRLTSKQKRPFGILSVEDLSGSADWFMVWSEELTKYADKLVTDAVIKIDGKTSLYNERIRVNVKDIEVLEEPKVIWDEQD
jgi:DNA polymerase-3 subunit alpha